MPFNCWSLQTNWDHFNFESVQKLHKKLHKLLSMAIYSICRSIAPWVKFNCHFATQQIPFYLKTASVHVVLVPNESLHSLPLIKRLTAVSFRKKTLETVLDCSFFNYYFKLQFPQLYLLNWISHWGLIKYSWIESNWIELYFTYF